MKKLLILLFLVQETMPDKATEAMKAADMHESLKGEEVFGEALVAEYIGGVDGLRIELIHLIDDLLVEHVCGAYRPTPKAIDWLRGDKTIPNITLATEILGDDKVLARVEPIISGLDRWQPLS